MPDAHADKKAPAGLGLAELPHGHGHNYQADHNIIAVMDDVTREVDHELGDSRQFGPHVLEHLGEGGHHEPQHDGDGPDRDTDQDDRIHQGPFDFAGRLAAVADLLVELDEHHGPSAR